MAARWFLAFARVNYSLVAVMATAFGLSCAVSALGSVAELPGSTELVYAWLATVILAAIFLFLGGRALVRKFRTRSTIPQPTEYRPWLRVVLLTLAGLLAHFMVVNVCLAFYQLVTGPQRESPGGPLAFGGAVAGICYLVALLLGEFGLRHETPSRN